MTGWSLAAAVAAHGTADRGSGGAPGMAPGPGCPAQPKCPVGQLSVQETYVNKTDMSCRKDITLQFTNMHTQLRVLGEQLRERIGL